MQVKCMQCFQLLIKKIVTYDVQKTKCEDIQLRLYQNEKQIIG